jgi:tetratricopeptide (TPR) repeat protein
MNRGVGIFVTGAFCLSVVACQHSRQEVRPASSESNEAAPQVVPATPIQELPATNGPAVEAGAGTAKYWIARGNRYFDSQQLEKAVEAYGKALELEPNNPDVLTDQGVMYRELGALDQAKANFEKASTIDPKHLQSLLNLGVLYAQDLKDPDKAITTWTRVIQIAPASVQAAKANAYIAHQKRVQELK